MGNAAETPELDVKEAASRLLDGAVMVDVRELEEWQAGRIAGAVHIPLGQLATRHGELDASGVLLLMCRSGMRSADATRALNGAGYDAHNVAGGMKAWVAAGQPIEPEGGFVA
ncbi:MAG: rhodanese-like domain-containing protein [Gaiellaceae bacterium]